MEVLHLGNTLVRPFGSRSADDTLPAVVRMST